MADREFLLRIVGDVASATKGIQTVQDDVSGMKKGMDTVGKAVAGAFAIGAVVSFGKSIAGAASDAEQSAGAIDSVFGDMADSIHASAADSAKNVGLATSEYEQLATLTGALLKNAGVPLDEVAKSTQNLTQVGADLSAMYGGTAADAMGAINSALKGEMDPLEAFGVSLKASAIEMKAVKMGLVDATGKATDYGKKMATITIIQEQSADAAGTFADEADSMAGQTQILGAQFKNLQADLGQKLLPVIVEVAGVLTKLVTFVIDNQSWLLPLAAGIGAIVLAMKAWTFATEAWTVATEIGTAIQTAFNFVMAMNPIGLIVIAIAALVAGFILAYKKVDWFREGVDAAVAGIVDAFEWVIETVEDVWKAIKFAYDWIKQNWPLLLAIITGPFGLAVYEIVKHWDTIKTGVTNVIESIRQWFSELPGKVSSALSNLAGYITAPFSSARDTVRGIIDAIQSKISGIRQWVSDAFWDLKDVITAPFDAAFRAIKNLWNQTVGGFSFSVPSWVPGVGGKGFSIPKMAAGGIVTRPTIALLGEAGPEAVVPLGNAGGFGNIVINVYALAGTAEVGKRVYESLREYERTTGRTIGTAASGSSLSAFAS